MPKQAHSRHRYLRQITRHHRHLTIQMTRRLPSVRTILGLQKTPLQKPVEGNLEVERDT